MLMSSRLPTSSDFPPHLHVRIAPPPASSPQPTNILILFHGLGDTSAPYDSLGRQLNLPETTCISLRAPTPMPFDLGGFHWGDDITFDQASGTMDPDSGFQNIVKIMGNEVIEEVLIKRCGYTHRDIILFGLGQGGMAALAIAASMQEELGGVISLGGSLPSSSRRVKDSKTPVLVTGGSSSTAITKTALMELKNTYSNVEYHKWKRAGDGMPQNREEMLPIMRFFARRLRSRQGVPEGSLEVG